MADIEAHQTASTIINRTAVLCSLDFQADPYASADPNFILLRELLNAAGQDIARQRPWTHLVRTYEFSTDGSTDYPLPADFASMVDQTGWVMNGDPLHGPATAQEWAYLKARVDNLSLRASFRLIDRRIVIHPVSDGIPIRLEYLSRAWVQAGDTPAIRRDSAIIPGDIVLFDPLLMVCRLRRDFLVSRGFDASIADGAYRNVYSAIAGQDGGASIYNLAKPTMEEWPVNVPDTGFG